MNTLHLTLFLILTSTIFAYLETQIEGSDGWAQNLPTWRQKINDFELTGYHLSIWIFLFLIMHFPALFVDNWTVKKECYVLSFFFLFLLCEDTLWFKINDNFNGDDYWRHPKFLNAPYFFYLCSLLVIFFSYIACQSDWPEFNNEGHNWFYVSLFTLFLNFISY